jgi:hypothetical protein
LERRSTSSERRLALLIGALFAIASHATAAATGDDADKAAALAARNESLRRELALAEGDSFYLVLDDETSMLTLMYKGAPLRETRVESAEIGAPRARHGDGADAPLDLYAPWTGGNLHPPRINVREEVVPPPLAGATPEALPAGAQRAEQGEFVDGDEGEAAPEATPVPTVEEVEIPKTPEELYPVPLGYEIRFAEGLVIEVVRSKNLPGAGAASTGKSAAGAPVASDHPEAYPTPPSPTFWERVSAAARRAALVRPEGERVRLRIVIDSLEADRLFRSLPTDVKLLIRRPAAPPSPARS